MSKDKIHMTWDEYISATNLMARSIKFLIRDEKLKKPILLGIKRGGAILATLLSHILDLDVEYIDVDKLTYTRYFSNPIIVIDDIADTGKTIKKLMRWLDAHPFYYYVMHTRVDRKKEIEPHYAVHNIDTWVVYPYEKIDK